MIDSLYLSQNIPQSLLTMNEIAAAYHRLFLQVQVIRHAQERDVAEKSSKCFG